MFKSLCTFVFLLSSAFAMVPGTCDTLNLAPHERKIYDLLNGVGGHHNTDELRDMYDKNAIVEVYTGQKMLTSGTYDEVFGKHWGDIERFATKWEPVTNTDAKHPANGAFALKWTHYLKSTTGCEAMYTGFSVVKFNSKGKIVSDRVYSREFETIWNCLEEQDL